MKNFICPVCKSVIDLDDIYESLAQSAFENCYLTPENNLYDTDYYNEKMTIICDSCHATVVTNFEVNISVEANFKILSFEKAIEVFGEDCLKEAGKILEAHKDHLHIWDISVEEEFDNYKKNTESN